ncbi:MAG TPA: PASTA domain-containing protein [bacterium]|nr:PASTA domain-containing protein [bacterium]
MAIREKSEVQKANSRIVIVYAAAGVVMLALVLQLFNLQLFKHSFFKRKAQQQHLSTIKQQVGRGVIFDRAGRKIAESVRADSVYVVPGQVRNKERTAAFLSRNLGVSKEFVLEKLKSKRYFEYIKRKEDPLTVERILAEGIRGVYSQAEEKRHYPLGEAASHIVGFAGTDNTGLEGLELHYERYLKGKTGRIQIKRDAMQRPIVINAVDIRRAERGADLYLTVDSAIQKEASAQIKNAVEKYRANAGSIIVMNPNTGAILAMANYPAYDPNDSSTFTPKAKRNRAVTDIFEPGSTFKIFTVSAYLKDFKEGMEHKVFCGNGSEEFFGRTVNDHDKFGWLTLPEVIKYSSNVGMVKMAKNIKQEKLYREFTRYGFGKRTGIDLPGEAGGILRSYRQWDNNTLISIPYGQEVAVTAVQLAAAYAVVANGGYVVKPHVVERIERNGRVIFRGDNKRKERIAGKDIRDKMTEMLKMAVESGGSGQRAAIAGYSVAGKTGTAQKHREDGKGYSQGRYVSSFIGFIPADRPELLTLVVVDEPRPSYYGGEVAAPVFRELSRSVISYLSMPPPASAVAAADVGAADETVIMPDFHLKRFIEARDFLRENKIRYRQYGNGHHVIGQSPDAGDLITADTSVYVLIGDIIGDNELRVYMPDIKGVPIRRAMEIMSKMGINARFEGSGFAVTQQPGPGVAVSKETICTVGFAMEDNT